MNLPERLIIIGCWVIFLGFWAVTASMTKDVAEREDTAGRLAYSLPLLVGVVLLFRGVGHSPHPWAAGNTVFPTSAALAWSGALLTILGLLLALWARVTLGRNWSSAVVVRKDHELIMRGPYALSRHPIYTAILLMFLGSALAIGTIAGYLLITISMLIKLFQEEWLMMRLFPEEYLAYRRRVKRLVPFIW